MKYTDPALLWSQGSQVGQQGEVDRSPGLQPVQVLELGIGLADGRNDIPGLKPSVPGVVDSTGQVTDRVLGKKRDGAQLLRPVCSRVLVIGIGDPGKGCDL